MTTDRDELMAAQRRARDEWKAGRLGDPVATLRCMGKGGRCGDVLGRVYRTGDGRLFLTDAWFRPGTREVRTIVADGESMPLLNLDPLPVFRLLDRRLADDPARGMVTISCKDHFEIPVDLELLALDVESGNRKILLDPTAYDRVSRRRA